MTTQIIEKNIQSGNSSFINKIPIQSEPPKDGEFAVYNEEDNQWKFEKPEYMQVVNTSDRNFFFRTLFSRALKFDKIITDLTPGDISFDIPSSTWTLQPGNYQLTACFPGMLISAPTSVTSFFNFNVYWKNITDDVTLKETGFIWFYNPTENPGKETTHSSTIDTIVKITEPTMFQLFIESMEAADITLTIGFFDAGFSSVIIKTL